MIVKGKKSLFLHSIWTNSDRSVWANERRIRSDVYSGKQIKLLRTNCRCISNRQASNYVQYVHWTMSINRWIRLKGHFRTYDDKKDLPKENTNRHSLNQSSAVRLVFYRINKKIWRKTISTIEWTIGFNLRFDNIVFWWFALTIALVNAWQAIVWIHSNWLSLANR